MTFRWRQKILFKHCDPARIVFYPRYFEMINDCVEAFFFDVLHYPFEDFHKLEAGAPTVQIDTTFHAISRHGDWLEFALQPLRVGRSSFEFAVVATCNGEKRMSAKATLVHIRDFVSEPWPQDVQEKIYQMIGDPQ